MRVRAELRGESYDKDLMDNYIGITYKDVIMQKLRMPVKPPCNNKLERT